MSETLLREIAERIAKEQFLLHWWVYCLMLAISFVFSIGGAYLGSYAKKRGEDFATKKSFEDLMSQLKATTDLVENIKSGNTHILEEIKSNYQLKFAAVEREKKTKKEVYMEVVEAIARSQNIIPSFANLNLEQEQITSNIVNDAGKIAKIQIVGSKETVKAVTQYMASIASAMLDLTLERSGLILQKQNISNLENLRNKAQQEISRYVGIMKNLNMEGNSDQILWGTINKNVDFEKKQIDTYQDNIAKLIQIQKKEHLEFTKMCMSKFFEISELLPPAVLSIRKELDMEISSDDYLNIFKNNIEKGKKIFGEFLTKAETRLG